MVSEARKQAMAWMETDYSKHTYFRWKVKWRLEHLGALGTMGEMTPLTYPLQLSVDIMLNWEHSLARLLNFYQLVQSLNCKSFPSPGGVPHGYTLIARNFYNLVSKHGQKERIKLLEYMREQWTFHAKGLWYYLPHKNRPFLTLIGSPNFGHRSVYRDLEAQVAIVTENEALSRALHQEQGRLYDRAANVTDATFELDDRKVPLWVRCVTRVMRSYFWEFLEASSHVVFGGIQFGIWCWQPK